MPDSKTMYEDMPPHMKAMADLIIRLKSEAGEDGVRNLLFPVLGLQTGIGDVAQVIFAVEAGAQQLEGATMVELAFHMNSIFEALFHALYIMNIDPVTNYVYWSTHGPEIFNDAYADAASGDGDPGSFRPTGESTDPNGSGQPPEEGGLRLV